MPIIITKQGKNAEKIQSSRFEQEGDLQAYIAENPDSLPLYEIKEDIRLLVVSREFQTDSGPIDALAVDKDGEIYILETKLYKNPDKRLVVAQVLDYGASLWRTQNSIAFLEQLDQAARVTFKVSLREKLAEFFGFDQEQCGEALKALETNHHNGAFHFVVLMDRLHDRLRDLVVFINQNSRFDIYAVEMEYYKFKEYEIVIPKLFGAEVKKEAALASSSRQTRKWDEQSFFKDVSQRLNPSQQRIIKKLYDASNDLGAAIYWGRGSLKGSFNPIFENICPRSIFSVYSNGVLSLSFGWLNGSMKAEQFRIAYKKAMAEDLQFPMQAGKEYFYYDPELWMPKCDRFIEVVGRLVSQFNR